MAKLKTRGGSDYSPDMQKVFDKLKQLLAGGKKLDLSIDEIKKKAGVPNAKNANISSLIIREKAKGNFKNLTVNLFSTVATTFPSSAFTKSNLSFVILSLSWLNSETHQTSFNSYDLES